MGRPVPRPAGQASNIDPDLGPVHRPTATAADTPAARPIRRQKNHLTDHPSNEQRLDVIISDRAGDHPPGPPRKPPGPLSMWSPSSPANQYRLARRLSAAALICPVPPSSVILQVPHMRIQVQTAQTTPAAAPDHAPSANDHPGGADGGTSSPVCPIRAPRTCFLRRALVFKVTPCSLSRDPAPRPPMIPGSTGD